VVEGQIIPRLLIAHCGSALDGAFPASAIASRHRELAALGLEPPGFHAQDIDRMAHDAIRHDAARLLEQVGGYLALGSTVESLLTDLLAPVARRLGEWWEEDVCDFVDVTMGLWRLQEVTRELVSHVPGAAAGPAIGRSAVFAVPPGETHVFGAVILEACFRRAGWVTIRGCDTDGDWARALVAEASVDLVGLSASTDAGLAALPACIAAIRRCSRNRHVKIMVGGAPFVAQPDLAERVGADATAADARVAVSLADRMCRTAAGESLAGGAR
ncbi:MAG: B12-binding domain-containing protein, partial [Thermaurantiacus sp.]